MKKILIALSAATLMGTPLVTTYQAVTSKKNKASYNNNKNGLASHQFHTDSPNQIISRIINTRFLVPINTNPDILNTQTYKTIKQYLQDANHDLSDKDLSFIHFQPLASNNLNNQTYTDIELDAIEGAARATTTISVKIATTVAAAINLYSPILGEASSSFKGIDYKDNVFLKTLQMTGNKKTVISNGNLLTDANDKADYQSMLKSHALQPGLVLLNKYLNNGLLKFDPHGYVPPRDSSINAVNKKQSVITLNSSGTSIKNIEFSVGDYVKIDIHWNYVNITLQPKMVSAIIKEFINKGLTDFVGKSINNVVTKIVTKLIIKLEILDLEVDGEIDAIGSESGPFDAIISGVSAVITQLITAGIGEWLDNNFKHFYEDIKGGPNAKISLFGLGDDPGLGLTLSINYFLIWNDRIGVTETRKWSSLTIPASPIQPSFFNASLKQPTTLSGTGENFTVAIGNDDFYSLENLLSKPDASLESIFNLFGWNVERIKSEKFTKNLFMSLLKYTSIPPGHFAVFHIVSGKVVWTNLIHDGKADYSLKVAQDGNLSCSFINENGITNMLVNEKIYLNISSRLQWVKSNWKYIQNSVSESNWQQYFEDRVINQNGINQYQLNYGDLETSLQYLSTMFAYQVKMSHGVNSSLLSTSYPQLMDIYYNPTKPLSLYFQPNDPFFSNGVQNE